MNARYTETKVLPVAADLAVPVPARDHVGARHAGGSDPVRVGARRRGAGVGRRGRTPAGWWGWLVRLSHRIDQAVKP